MMLPPVVLGRNGQGVVCRTCGAVVWWKTDRFNGCECDPDAPTWVGINPTGRVYSSRTGNYYVFTEQPE